MKQLTGTIVSTKMAKTAVVLVSFWKTHPFYKKKLRRKKKYLADNTLGAKEGDKVNIKPSLPISKRKRWLITKVL